MTSAYCERSGDAFWGEPLNAASNVAFLLAALVAFLVWRRRTPDDGAIAALIALVALIGLGSFLFHTVPGSLTVLLDVVPIQLFIIGYFALVLHRFVGLSAPLTIAGLIGFLAVGAGVPLLAPRGALAGGLAYVPALLALLGLGLFLLRRDRVAARSLLSGAALFTVSLAMRTLDQPLCPRWPLGLHFVWHCLNGGLLLVLLLAAIGQGQRSVRIRPAS
ncbi:MAG: hypothetical protein K2P80_07060 [Beijerinckiaceae bacterium]|nr:hypothetical protein [Beijerinckiaceae bacterium]